jgi:hypothetical protein
MNLATIETQTGISGDAEDNISASIHVIMVLKSLAHASRTNHGVVPHMIGIAKGLDATSFLPSLAISENNGKVISPIF